MQASTTAVIVIGESLMDVVTASDGTNEHAGGSPMNVAVGLSRLGVPVELLTRIGDDARGQIISNALADDGVSLFPGSITAQGTSTSTATLDTSGAATYEFDIVWAIDSVVTLPLTPIIHTGSIAAFLEPGASHLASLLRAVDPSTIVTFDPNIRPSIIGSRDGAKRIVNEITSLSTIVKMSDEDMLWLYGPVSADEGIDRLLAAGATLAIVTLGASGALLATATERVTVPGEIVSVIDTIGAGDSFMSAIISQIALLLDREIDARAIIDGTALTAEVLTRIGKFAARCAGITVSRTGSNPPVRADLG